MIDHLLSHKRAALFCGLGLRKTASTLLAFDTLHALGEANRMLVVAPLRVCNLTWPNEAAKWVPHLRLANLRTTQAVDQADICVCNYEMLPKMAGAMRQFDTIVFDEITRAKSHRSKRIRSVRQDLPDRRWGLTGTPMPNSTMELFAQIRLLDDGERLGRSFEQFKQTYFYPIDYMRYDWRPLPGSEEKIRARIADITLTLLSSDYADVPDTVVEDLEVAMPPEAQKLYDRLEKDLLVSLGSGRNVVVAVNAAVLVNKLLQVAGGSVYDEKKEVVRVHDAKLGALQAYLKKHPEPVLIAYNYRHELDQLKRAFPAAVAFEDATTTSAQQQVERDWNLGKIPRLLVHPASVGHGLNLQHGGSTVIWFSLTWSREMYDQLNGRVARQGQKQLIHVIRIICPGTIDDAVVETLREKGDNQTNFLTVLTNLRRLKDP